MAVFALLFGAALVLSYAPFDLGNLRVAGVSLLWWYAFGIAPAAAVLTAALLLWRSD